MKHTPLAFPRSAWERQCFDAPRRLPKDAERPWLAFRRRASEREKSRTYTTAGGSQQWLLRGILDCSCRALCVLGAALAMVLAPRAAGEETSKPEKVPAGWTFACSADNDIYHVLAASRLPCPRFATAAEAVRAAIEDSGVLILGDGYPEQPTAIEPAVFDEAAQKRLRLYVEYPERLPDMETGPPKDVKYLSLIHI